MGVLSGAKKCHLNQDRPDSTKNVPFSKACPSSGKVVITVAPGIGFSAATGSGAQAALKWWCLQWEQRSRAKIPGNQLG